MKKRILSMILSMVMLFTMLPAFSLTASAADTSGSCGEKATWSFDSTSGTLTISGTGTISDYQSFTGVPWYSHMDNIFNLEINEGITAVGTNAFYFHRALTHVELPMSVKELKSQSFGLCTNLKYISYAADATVDTNAFASITNLNQWNGYELTLDDNVDTTVNVIAKVNKAYAMPEPAKPTNGDYVFGGWYTDAACIDENRVSFPFTANSTNPVTFYAKWNEPADHNHEWEYSLSTTNTENDTITAVCKVKNCDGGSVVLSVVDPAPVYTGNVLAPATLTNTLLETPDGFGITYTKKGVAADPINAGTYIASIKLGDAEASVECKIEKGNRSSAPSAPTMASFTETTLTLNTQTGCEYSMDGTDWQESPTFEGLTTGTLYSFYARYAETDNQYASGASKAVLYILGQETPVEGTLTIKPTNAANTITKGTDYTYNNGVLNIKTSTPVTIGLLSGVTSSADVIEVDETAGTANVTLDNVVLDIPTGGKTYSLLIDANVTCTLNLVGTNKITNNDPFGTGIRGNGYSADKPINITITSATEGSLEISSVYEVIDEYSYSPVHLTVQGNAKFSAKNSKNTVNCIELETFAAKDNAVVSVTTTGGANAIWSNKNATVSGNAEITILTSGTAGKGIVIKEDGSVLSISDNAKIEITSSSQPVDGEIAVTPAEGKVYQIDTGKSSTETDTRYYMEANSAVSSALTDKYFKAQSIDFIPILSASASIDAPVKNGTPATTAETASDVNYTVSAVTWNGDPTKFLGGTEYTATFTLTPDAGYAFVSDTAVTVAGATIVDKTLNGDGSLTVNAKFPATDAAVPVSIAVKTEPGDVEYTYGDEFDPTGLVITVTNDDGTAQDVTYNDETADDFAFSPNELTVATTQITVTYAGKTAEIGITVAKQPVTAPDNAGSKQFTGETLTSDVDVTNKPYMVTTNEGGINVGEYDVVLTLTDPDNYKWSDSEEAEKTIKFSITKADALTLNGTATMVKDHANHTVEIDLTSISGYPTNPGGTPAFALTSGNTYNGLTSVTLNGSVLTLVADKTTNDTVDTVTVAVTGMGNYADTTTITITVSYTDKTVATITGVEAAENLIYSGEVQPGYTGTPSSEYNGAYTITYTGTDKTGKAYGPTSDAPVNAGDYSVTFAVPDSSTQYAGSKTINFTINKKSVTVSADNKEAYVWGRMPELTYKAVGLIGNDSINVDLSCDANMNRVGEYPIVVSANDESGNYEITTVNGTLTVKMIYIPIIPSDPTYPPVVEDGDNGEVTVTPAKPEKGDTVIITPDPDAGYEVDEVIVTDKNGNPVTVVDNGDGTYSFKQPTGKVTIEVTYKEIDTTCPRDWTCPMYGYTDLDRTAWYHDGVHFCIENGLMQGIGNNQFAPSSTTTRAMIVTILWRLEGSPVVNYAMDFEDVAANQWYTEAIRWAAKEKIVEGYGNGKFGTNDAITREQMVTIMYRYAKYKGYDVSVGENTNILSYGDAFDVAEWAIPAMQWACGEGIITGIADGSTMNLDPQGNATRAQAAAILQRYCENVAKKD